MSDEIVRRLRSRNNKSLSFLKESLRSQLLSEADEDEEEEELDTVEPEGEDGEDFPEEEYGSEEEESPEEDNSDPTSGFSSHSTSLGSHSSSSTPQESPDDSEEDTVEFEEDGTTDNVNPLDNQYAVKFKMGDRVALAYANGTATDAEATIEGYDKEGFYRIKVDGGFTINGITDIALTSIVKGVTESTCICGHKSFAHEDGKVVCDRCGRIIRESSDVLNILDKSRGKGKKLIRSEAHPISTANKPNISENIRKAFKRSAIREEEEQDSPFEELKSLEGEFWTRLSEIVEDIEDLGYEVLESNMEYIVVANDEDDSQMQIPLGGTARTMTLDFKRAKIV